MMKKSGWYLLSAVLLAALAAQPARAQDYVSCFSAEDFGTSLQGICLKGLPAEGTLVLGSRILRPGDVLTAEQIGEMTYCSTSGSGGALSYLPIGEEGVRETAAFQILGKKDQPPVAQDSLLETYQNLSNMGKLRVSDPEGQVLTIEVTRQPVRGTLTVEADGRFLYTPKKNKVGMDSFAYRASDPKGNLSREATVTVNVLKPSEEAKYRDTASLSCAFAAQWMKNTGIFAAENVGDTCCFQPEKKVEKGEFLTMLVKTLGIPPEPELAESLRELPAWLRPYGAAALRSGLTAGIWDLSRADAPITQGEAAVMVQNALDLPVPAFSGTASSSVTAAALAALRSVDLDLQEAEPLTRAQAAELLYSVHRIRQGS